MLLKQCIFVACIVLGSNLAAAAAHDVPPHVSGSPLADIVNRHRASSARELPAYHGVPAPSAAISTHPEHRGDAAVAQAPLPASIDRGMTFFSLSPDAFSDPATLAELDALSEMGGEWVGCVIFLHMSSPTSSTISIDDSTASDASVITFLKHAATLPNIKVMVKPIVVPHGGTMLNIVPKYAVVVCACYHVWLLTHCRLVWQQRDPMVRRLQPLHAPLRNARRAVRRACCFHGRRVLFHFVRAPGNRACATPLSP